jgi:hypothetical protein
MTYDRVVPAVDELSAAGLLIHQKASPGDLQWQSRFKASPKLIAACLDRKNFIHRRRELIILRSPAEKKDIDYKETDETRTFRRNLIRINQCIREARISLGDAVVRDGIRIWFEGSYPALASSTLVRIFNDGSFRLGGRFYCGWWQNIPKALRAIIRIDGAPTIERDFRQLHPRLLYAYVGSVLETDPYEVPTWPRALAKMAFNTLINAPTESVAAKAIAQEIGAEGAHKRARALIAALKLQHGQVADKFGTGFGKNLMRDDSDIAERVMMSLLQKGIVILPIHDSFIVRQDHDLLLAEAMCDALNVKVRSLVNRAEKTNTRTILVPQNGLKGPWEVTGPARRWFNSGNVSKVVASSSSYLAYAVGEVPERSSKDGGSHNRLIEFLMGAV